MANVFGPVFEPVNVSARSPAFSKKSGELVAVKLRVAAGVLPDASMVAPPPTVLTRIARLVLCAVEPVYCSVPPWNRIPTLPAESLRDCRGPPRRRNWRSWPR